MSPIKPSAQPTLVRTQHLPPGKAPRSGPLRVVAAGRLASYGTVSQRRRHALAFSLVRGLPTRCAVPRPGLLWVEGWLEIAPYGAGCWGDSRPSWGGMGLPRWVGCTGAGRNLAGVPAAVCWQRYPNRRLCPSGRSKTRRSPIFSACSLIDAGRCERIEPVLAAAVGCAASVSQSGRRIVAAGRRGIRCAVRGKRRENAALVVALPSWPT